MALDRLEMISVDDGVRDVPPGVYVRLSDVYEWLESCAGEPGLVLRLREAIRDAPGLDQRAVKITKQDVVG